MATKVGRSIVKNQASMARKRGRFIVKSQELVVFLFLIVFLPLPSFTITFGAVGLMPPFSSIYPILRCLPYVIYSLLGLGLEMPDVVVLLFPIWFLICLLLCIIPCALSWNFVFVLEKIMPYKPYQWSVIAFGAAVLVILSLSHTFELRNGNGDWVECTWYELYAGKNYRAE